MSNCTYEMQIGDAEFEFEVTTPSHNKFLNDMTMDDKVSPAFNFLMATVVPAQKQQLKNVLRDDRGLVRGGVASNVVNNLLKAVDSEVTVGAAVKKLNKPSMPSEKISGSN